MISARTKAALAAAKARGVRLGTPANLRNQGTGQERGRARQTARAAGRAGDLAPIIAEIQAGGTTSGRGIAMALNARGIPAARGGAWSDVQVRRVLASPRQLRQLAPTFYGLAHSVRGAGQQQ